MPPCLPACQRWATASPFAPESRWRARSRKASARAKHALAAWATLSWCIVQQPRSKHCWFSRRRSALHRGRLGSRADLVITPTPLTSATLVPMNLAWQIQAVQGEPCCAAGRQDRNGGVTGPPPFPHGGGPSWDDPSRTSRFLGLQSDRRAVRAPEVKNGGAIVQPIIKAKGGASRQQRLTRLCRCVASRLTHPRLWANARAAAGPMPIGCCLPFFVNRRACRLEYSQYPVTWAPVISHVIKLGHFPCPRAHENAAFDCMQTTESPKCILLVRSWSDPAAEGVQKPATLTVNQVRKGVI